MSLSYTDDVFKDVEENTRSKILQTYAEGIRGRNQSDLQVDKPASFMYRWDPFIHVSMYMLYSVQPEWSVELR